MTEKAAGNANLTIEISCANLIWPLNCVGLFFFFFFFSLILNEKVASFV